MRPKSPLVHIDNFDARKFQVVNSPRSRDAMTQLCVQKEDLRLKTEEDLKGMFNTDDPKEKEALKACVEKHTQAHKNIVKKISDRRREMIDAQSGTEKKKKEQESFKSKQLKHLEEEKKAILKRLEDEQKKKDEAEKKQKAEHERDAKKAVKSEMEKDRSPKQLDRSEKTRESPNASQIRGQSAITHKSDQEHKPPLILDQQLKESSILVYLDKSVHHKDQLDVNLKERTKKDLKNDIQKMRDHMKRQKDELLEMAQKRTSSAYKNHEGPGNAKTRKIEYLYDLSRDPVSVMKEKQQKEMESMMNYELALQVHPSLT